MKTYQDLLEITGEGVTRNEEKVMEFVRATIDEYMSDDLYNTAVLAEEYYKKKNRTITRFEKTITTVTGRIVPDEWSANHKVVSGFFKRFVTDQNSFSLGNGCVFGDNKTKNKLGGVKFDKAVQKAGKWALIGGVSYLFWNLDHAEVFLARSFAPYIDEENGALRGGVRWWQVASDKPLRATLYEEDGYTEYIWNRDEKGKIKTKGEVLHPKQGYIKIEKSAPADETTDIEWRNYPAFPIVPLWANEERQSEIIGIQDGIDAYDLIKNGFENDLDQAQVFWVLKSAGGMEDPDLARFMDRLKKLAVAAPADGQEIEPVTVQIPYEARERLLDRLEHDLYRDFMALDTDKIASGAVTATQITASYKPSDSKATDYEYQVGEAVEAILVLAGIDDKVTFQRDYIVNTGETIGWVLQSAQYFTPEYVTKKLLTLLGDGDLADDMIDEMHENELKRMTGGGVITPGSGAKTEGEGSVETEEQTDEVDETVEE